MAMLSPSRSSVSRAARRLSAVALVALLAVGCGAPFDYFYRPAENATAVASGLPAARYVIPPNEPRGDVRITSFGITEIGHEDGPDLPSIHVRMVVANNGDAHPWSIDTREVLIDLHDGKPRGPAFANVGRGTLPVVTIPTAQQRVLDLFYPLPRDRQDAEDIPAFDVVWRLATADKVFVERTPFERVEIERVPPVDWQLVYGPAWWYDPWYPGVTILRPTVMMSTRPLPPAHIRIRSPRR